MAMNDNIVLCHTCGDLIPPSRLKALKNTIFCVKCSKTEKYVGEMEYAGTKGTAAYLIIVSKEEKKARDRANKRGIKKRIYDFRDINHRPIQRK